MTISLNKIVRQVRIKQQDNNEIKYSDYDIINAVNECIRYINQSFSQKNSDFLEKKKTYCQVEMNEIIQAYNDNLPDGEDPKELLDFAATGADLPEDFLSLADVLRTEDKYHLAPVPAVEDVGYGTYKVFANKIYCTNDFTLLYRAYLTAVKDIANDSVDLPTMFLDLIVKVTGMILLNNADTDVLMGEINRLIDSLVINRRYHNVKKRMPFIC